MSDLLPRLTAALTGRYQIERELGQGGMATVFLALDERHHRRVAIKVFSPELSAILGQERFLKEIEVTASLQHPHILPLFDSGAADGLLYYVMPFVEGETLRARLERERQLPVTDAVRIGSDVADALEYAHRRGVVHRDIKPENVLLQDGRPLVADFGIALAVQEAGGTRMTQTGMSLGTPHYMAPEQAMGEKAIDHRADLFSLGAMTYEMLAGEPPFTGPTMQAVVARVLTSEPVSLATLRRSIPAHVAATVEQALEKLPADRPQSAAAFGAGLTRASVGEVSTVAVRARTPRSFLLAVVGSGALLAGGLLGGWYLARPEAPSAPAQTRFLLAPPDSVELQAVCCGDMFTFSPDGRTLVFQGRPRSADTTTAAAVQLYARDLDNLRIRPLPGTAGAASLSFSPDGRELAYVERQKLFRVTLDGAPPRLVATLPPGFVGGTSWISPDSVAVSVGTSLLVVEMQRGATRTLYGPDTAARQPTSASYVAEGDGILFSFARLDLAPHVHWIPRSGGTPRPIVRGATPRYVAAWKRLVVVQGSSLVAYPFDPVRGDTTGPPVGVTDEVVTRSPILAHGEYAVTPGGQFAVARRTSDLRTGLVQMVDGAADTVVSLVQSGFVASARYSPDGQRLAFFLGDVQFTTSDPSRVIYTYDIARKVATRVTTEPDARLARWTPDGDSLVYLLSNTGQLAIRRSDGSGAARRLPDVLGWSIAEFSMWESWLAVSGSRASGSSSDIGVVHRDSGGQPRPYLTTTADELDPELSPDGKWLAYTSNETGAEEVYVSPFPDPSARYRVSAAGGRLPRWSRDGRTLYYAAPASFLAVPFTVAGEQPTLGTPRTIYRRPTVRSWDVTNDGKRMLFIDTVRLLELLGLEVVMGFDPAATGRTPE